LQRLAEAGLIGFVTTSGAGAITARGAGLLSTNRACQGIPADPFDLDMATERWRAAGAPSGPWLAKR
jgi:LDH2 family malate/lactate/ureidoglycolate dehydrogenase